MDHVVLLELPVDLASLVKLVFQDNEEKMGFEATTAFLVSLAFRALLDLLVNLEAKDQEVTLDHMDLTDHKVALVPLVLVLTATDTTKVEENYNTKN